MDLGPRVAEAKHVILLSLQRAARKLGLEVTRAGAFGLRGPRRGQMLAQHDIDLVLDVGANSGQYATELRRQGYRGRIVSFEPVNEPFLELSRHASGDARWECRQVALANSEGTAEIHVAGNSAMSSSLLEMKERHVLAAPDSAYVGSEQVGTARLDQLASEVADGAQHIFLKLDVQGAEDRVLQGGTDLLSRVDLLEIELSLVRLYDGQWLLPEMLTWLAERGFTLIGMEPVLRDPSSGYLLQVDGFFARC
jgi:FkbM family methyltransferase